MHNTFHTLYIYIYVHTYVLLVLLLLFAPKGRGGVRRLCGPRGAPRAQGLCTPTTPTTTTTTTTTTA